MPLHEARLENEALSPMAITVSAIVAELVVVVLVIGVPLTEGVVIDATTTWLVASQARPFLTSNLACIAAESCWTVTVDIVSTTAATLTTEPPGIFTM